MAGSPPKVVQPRSADSGEINSENQLENQPGEPDREASRAPVSIESWPAWVPG